MKQTYSVEPYSTNKMSFEGPINLNRRESFKSLCIKLIDEDKAHFMLAPVRRMKDDGVTSDSIYRSTAKVYTHSLILSKQH